MGRLSNSPPPKSAQKQNRDSEAACEWHGWATVEIRAGSRKSAIFADCRLARSGEKTVVFQFESGHVGQPPPAVRRSKAPLLIRGVLSSCARPDIRGRLSPRGLWLGQKQLL